MNARRVLRALAVLAGAFVLWLLAVWPPPVWYRTHWPRETAFMEMRRAARPRRGAAAGFSYHPVPLDSIAAALPGAVMAGEDRRFWEHHGIDWWNLRAALGYRRGDFSWASSHDRSDLSRALGTVWERREALRGASTITQQLAKNLYLSPSRSPLRKVKEAVTAYRLEVALEKRRILELYLNIVELGDGVWGVDAAARTYFGRPAAFVSQAQAAALAATLPFPLSSNPAHRPGRMEWRQALILRKLRGEDVEVPQVEAEDVPPAPDSLAADSIMPGPADSSVSTIQDSVGDSPADSIGVEAAPDSIGQLR